MLIRTNLFFIVSILFLFSCMNAKQVDQSAITTMEDLWVHYTPVNTVFKIWSPEADAVRLNLYSKGWGGDSFETHALLQDVSGIWILDLPGDWKGKYYTFQIKWQGQWLEETPGIYASATGVNGNRACVVDFEELNPIGWENDKWIDLSAPNKAVIYELHIRDMSIHESSGSRFQGKYLGLVESGTKNSDGLSTGIDHLKELGITHVHLLPVFDFMSIDESKPETPQFNWGYDPQNYNVPEGSYATNPFDADIRIREFKQMVQAFHQQGIGVIMDVVYNHTGKTENSNFNLEYPNYYYRFNADGSYSNASGCGNETASEKPMMRKFMLESILFWANEYHIDGFRFDLMGIHDIETMNLIADSLKLINPSCIIYGEGWTGGSSPLGEEFRAVKKHVTRLHNISAFSDDLRDGLKGSVFEDESRGFVSGVYAQKESIKFGVVGSILHDQLSYKKVNYSDTSWAVQPWQSVAYVSCHDNHTLFDKLKVSNPEANIDQLIDMQLLSLAIVLTSQGVPFLHAGTELLRTKNGEHNSYNLSDEINQIDWNRKTQFHDVNSYVANLIRLRKSFPVLSLGDAGAVRKSVSFLNTEEGVVGFTIENKSAKEPISKLMVIYNAKPDAVSIVEEGSYLILAKGRVINIMGIEIINDVFEIPARSAFIAVQNLNIR